MYALSYARDHLSDDPFSAKGAPLRDQVRGRAVALVAAAVGLAAVGSAASMMTGPAKGALWPLLGLALVVCAVPLLLPAGTIMGRRVSAVGLVSTSMLLTLLSGVVLAIYFVVRIILSNPEVLR